MPEQGSENGLYKSLKPKEVKELADLLRDGKEVTDAVRGNPVVGGVVIAMMKESFNSRIAEYYENSKYSPLVDSNGNNFEYTEIEQE